MSNNYRVIDEKTWKRATHCMAFRNSIEPAFCVTFEADITNFKRKVKEQEFSFTMAMVYAVCRYANQIEAFRYRFLDDQIILFDHIDTAFTYLNPETELFKAVNVPMIEDIKDNATPLFDWGKYYEKEGKFVIPISVQAHHSFVGGLHIGQFAEQLQSFFDEY